jgi:hypothetical protein
MFVAITIIMTDNMFTANDLNMLADKGITPEQATAQLTRFKSGFPYPSVTAPASVEYGIKVFDAEELDRNIKAWNEYMSSGHDVLKFVPASGAATRMFKALYEYMNGSYDFPSKPEKEFFDNIRKYAFFDILDSLCLAYTGTDLSIMMRHGDWKTALHLLLDREGMNYGGLPKGLLLFHSCQGGEKRTAFEEHLVEGAGYAKTGDGRVRLHFTVSPEHEELFRKLSDDKKETYGSLFNVNYDIGFSTQKPSTDTIAVDNNDEPFRTDDGSIVFRPGGHGALIENLNDLTAEVVFLKNIDNVAASEEYRQATVLYKKVLAGYLVMLQKRIFDYLRLIDGGQYDKAQVEEMIHFVQDELCTRKTDLKYLEDAELIIYLRGKLDRPIRVCGMVRNQGEPGGGPFLTVNPDGTVSPQILESSQLDMNDPSVRTLFENGTHFNPVDIVCGVYDYKGNKYDLLKYVDPDAGFISCKSMDGRPLKALELPGLWNGAMGDWNTILVEVPHETFAPVKTVFDLLRPEHQ